MLMNSRKASPIWRREAWPAVGMRKGRRTGAAAVSNKKKQRERLRSELDQTPSSSPTSFYFFSGALPRVATAADVVRNPTTSSGGCSYHGWEGLRTGPSRAGFRRATGAETVGQLLRLWLRGVPLVASVGVPIGRRRLGMLLVQDGSELPRHIKGAVICA